MSADATVAGLPVAKSAAELETITLEGELHITRHVAVRVAIWHGADGILLSSSGLLPSPARDRVLNLVIRGHVLFKW